MKAKEVGKEGLVTRSLSRYCLLVRLGVESEEFKEGKKIGVFINMKVLYWA